ncbi:hypothetical protein H4R35_003778 [Dimargaris xerosporica]|nr:hypothetical protein H4R35_003778 [Dimargaris xerosporica]
MVTTALWAVAFGDTKELLPSLLTLADLSLGCRRADLNPEEVPDPPGQPTPLSPTDETNGLGASRRSHSVLGPTLTRYREVEAHPALVSQAQAQLVGEIHRRMSPVKVRESFEETSGLFLAVESLVLYYTLGYPTGALRTLEQTFLCTLPSPIPVTSQAALGLWRSSATPLYLQCLAHKATLRGTASLWQGFTTSVVSQVAHILYGYTFKALSPHRSLVWTSPYTVCLSIGWVVRTKAIQFLAAIPLYPLWHLAAIWRLKNAAITTTQRFDAGQYVRDYWRIVRHMLSPTIPWRMLVHSPHQLLLSFGPPALYPLFVHKVLFDYLQTHLVFPCVHYFILQSRHLPLYPRWLARLISLVNPFQTLADPAEPLHGDPADLVEFMLDASTSGTTFPEPISAPIPAAEPAASSRLSTRWSSIAKKSMLYHFFPEMVSVLISNLASKMILYPLESLYYVCMAHQDLADLAQSGMLATVTHLAPHTLTDVSSPYHTAAISLGLISGPTESFRGAANTSAKLLPGIRGCWTITKAIYHFAGYGMSGFYGGFWRGLVADVLVSYAVIECAYQGYRLFSRLIAAYG